MLSPVAHAGILVSLVALARCDPEIGPDFIRYPVTAVDAAGITGITKVERQNAVPLTNGKTGTLYTIPLSIGTPAQPLVVVLDTGSSDLWVNPTCSAAPTQIEFCNSFPQFDYTASSTLNDTGKGFRLSYGKGSALVEYVTDVVTLGSLALRDQTFGINTASNDIPLGILGLAPWLGGRLPKYAFVLDTMAAQGKINSRAFSLDLRSIDSPDGSVIFGGLDTKKYIGSLEKRAIIPATAAPSGTDRYWIYLTSVGITNPGGSPTSLYSDASPGLPVFPDSGGTLTRLPTPLYRAIGEAFIALFPDTFLDTPSGYYVVDCSIRGSAGGVDFGFGAKTIRVAYKDIIWDLGRPELNLCVVGVLPDDDEPVLGDSFLRAAYVVYDQDNRNVHFAQAANCGTELVAIGKGPDAVPSITGGCGTDTGSSPTSSGTKTSAAPTKPSSKTTTTGSQFTASYPNATAPTTVTFTITSSTVHTITSCASTVTQCPYGQVVTEAVTVTTTYCPGSTDSYNPTTKPAPTVSISAPCLNCDVPSSSSSLPRVTATVGNLPTTTAGSKPTAVVTAGAVKGSGKAPVSLLLAGLVGAVALV